MQFQAMQMVGGETTKYELINQTGHAETVHVTYDAKQISLKEILLHYFRIINPTSKNKQGNDVGTQYRTGVITQMTRIWR